MDDPAALRQFLKSRHVNCSTCGYDLCDLETHRCPECGQAIELIIAPQRPAVRRSYDLITMLGGVFLGIGALIGTILLRERAPPYPVAYVIYAALPMLLAPVIVHATAHALSRLAPARHYRIAALMAAMIVLWLVLLYSFLR